MEMSSMGKVVLFTMTIAVLGIAVCYDLRFRRIPNWLTFPAMVAGIAYHTYDWRYVRLFCRSFGGLILGFAVFFVFYAYRWHGRR